MTIGKMMLEEITGQCKIKKAALRIANHCFANLNCDRTCEYQQGQVPVKQEETISGVLRSYTEVYYGCNYKEVK